MDEKEALKKIKEAKSFRETCWAIDDIAKETKDKNLLIEVFNIAEKKAEVFNDFRNIAERCSENIKDKNTAIKYYRKLESKIKEFDECIDFAESVVDNIKDKKWAINIYKKAENMVDEKYQLEDWKSLSESILKTLKDKKWHKRLIKKINAQTEKPVLIKQVKKNDNNNLVGQEITIYNKIFNVGDFNIASKIKKNLKDFIKEADQSSSSMPVLGTLDNKLKKISSEKSELINSDNLNVEYKVKNTGDLFKKPPKGKILLVYYYQYLSSEYEVQFLKDIKKVIFNINNFDGVAILSKNNKDIDFNNNSADKPTETYIKVFLSNGKKLEHRLSDQKQLIKDLENIKF